MVSKIDENRLDIIVLGASGFTGKYVVQKLLSLGHDPEYCDLKWGIAGRSLSKLQDVLKELQLGTSTASGSISEIPRLECDINNENALNNVCQRTKVLLNATGPNTLLSDPVVKSCIANKTHYLDISAELYTFFSESTPMWTTLTPLSQTETLTEKILHDKHMINLYRKYHKEAEKAGVLVVSACGFGSVPALIGLLHLERSFEGKLHSVECYTELDLPRRAYLPGPNKCLVHYGTWECFVMEMTNYRRYKRLKQITFPEPPPLSSEMKKRFFHKKNGKIWFPYPGPDHDIVEMTQNYWKSESGKTPYHFKIYTTLPWLLHFFILVPLFFIAYYLCVFRCFSRLLLKFPRFFSLGYFSHKGPSKEMMDDTKYSFTLNGRGWSRLDYTNPVPNKTLTVKVTGSDPGYKTTATAFVISAVTIIKENDKIPKGGVLTTAAVFYDTSIVDKLNKYGIDFEVIDNQLSVSN